MVHFLKFCQLSNFCQLRNLFFSQRDLSWGKTESKLKERCGRWKTISKGMVHRIIATITVTLVCGTKLFNLTLFTRLLNYERSSRRWNLMSLSSSWPSRANSALPPISGNNTFLPWPDLCNDLNYFCSQPYYLCTSACRSHCLRYWPLNYTGFFYSFLYKGFAIGCWHKGTLRFSCQCKWVYPLQIW